MFQLFKAAAGILLEDSKQGSREGQLPFKRQKRDFLLEGYWTTVSSHISVGCSALFTAIIFSSDSCSVAS